MTTKKPQGKAPAAVAKAEDVTKINGWYDVSKTEAMYLLIPPSIKIGTYLIRKGNNDYELSVKVQNNAPNGPIVREFNITAGKDGRFCIEPNRTWFPTISKLLEHYRQNASKDLDNCKLTAPCPKKRAPAELSEAKFDYRDGCVIMKESLAKGTVNTASIVNMHGMYEAAVKIKYNENVTNAEILRECETLLEMSHTNVIQLFGICTQVDPHYVILEYMEKGSLSLYLRRDNGDKLHVNHLVAMMIQIAEGLNYVHQECAMVHRNLKASHILVGRNKVMKLANFNLAKEVDIHDHDGGVYIREAPHTYLESLLSARWMALESGMTGKFSMASDIWSFGILMWEIVTYGGMPYAEMKTDAEILNAIDKGYRMPEPDPSNNPKNGPVNCDKELYGIMLDCWRSVPRQRKSSSQLIIALKSYQKNYQSGG